VFDAAHALGATRNGRPVGGFGAAEVFSFHATKIVNAFEGGAIVTDDDDLAARVRGLSNFGFENPGIAAAVGTNAKMSEAAAAMGLTSLDTLADCVRHNEEIYDLYLAEVGHLDGISLVPFNRADVSNFQYVVIRIDEAVAGLARDTLMAVLRAENIMAQRYFWPPCHRMPAYDSPSSRALPVTERLSEQVIALPTGPAVGREDVRRICDVVRLAVTHPRLVNERRPQVPTPGGVHR
jgi:dTDP-4-amino-4,6-dideoxyglucose